ncbi:1-phosphatidylinositol-4,5-bisphosphate phosphodiesterase gamma-2 [Zalerion maritima]|uniref:Phosphoinositide phospholipase C n=1 Tax=Zalerion maritima TaxID=339359 RepID=A0AAD5WXT9_9PEZI|nr:1-phosphatidylinositol-4,5-bisphosphate phosphodiesterase gamma-2 [Zalerion maritima]
MSSSHLAKDPANQAGGGVSGTPKTIDEVQASVLNHLKQIFERSGRPGPLWGREEVKHFVEVEQGEKRPLPQWLENKLSKNQTIDFKDFLKYMTYGEANSTHYDKEEDLSHPLASYFISSSHNTYLEGNQLSSDSTAEAYTNVLKRGCRCVEIDAWDAKEGDFDESSSDSSEDEAEFSSSKGKLRSKLSSFKNKLFDSDSDGGKTNVKKVSKKTTVLQAVDERFPAPVGVLEPKVYHGYTVTKPVSFRKVCIAILDDAFTASELPLVVSLEVHCGPDQQEQMVKIMKQVWDGYLIDLPEHEPKVLPPPAELKNKILVKVKYAPHIKGGEEQAAEDGQTDDDEITPPEGKTVKVSKIIYSLSDMGVYARGISFKSLDHPTAKMPTHIYSLSEKKVFEVDPLKLFEHNKKYLMRTYPAGTRVTSSNFNPVPRWNKGIQVTALNWQEWDEGMMLNEGMFAGTKGWVLKPQGFHPGDTSPPKGKILDLCISVLAAQNLPLPEADDKAKKFEPYVKCEVHYDEPHGHEAVSSVEREEEYKARTDENKGIHPDFRGQELVFTGIPGVMEELAFVRFTVRDDELGRDDLSAWACIRLDRLQEGYRFVQLLDQMGQRKKAVLFVKVSKTLR